LYLKLEEFSPNDSLFSSFPKPRVLAVIPHQLKVLQTSERFREAPIRVPNT
jgi:hypothetical protein